MSMDLRTRTPNKKINESTIAWLVFIVGLLGFFYILTITLQSRSGASDAMIGGDSTEYVQVNHQITD